MGGGGQGQRKNQGSCAIAGCHGHQHNKRREAEERRRQVPQTRDAESGRAAVGQCSRAGLRADLSEEVVLEEHVGVVDGHPQVVLLRLGRQQREGLAPPGAVRALAVLAAPTLEPSPHLGVVGQELQQGVGRPRRGQVGGLQQLHAQQRRGAGAARLTATAAAAAHPRERKHLQPHPPQPKASKL
jgi:hypothetical protein